MAFECQRDTEIKLREVLPDCLNNPQTRKVHANLPISITKKKLESLEIDTPAGFRIGGSFADLPAALISEIFNFLDPRELGTVSCVNTSLYRVASEHQVWKEFYHERWGHPLSPLDLGSSSANEKSWKELFVEREFRSKIFMGRYSLDTLYGHTEAVRTVFILVSKKLVFTSGYDHVVRMWDMEEGLLIASSRPLGCTIRAVAADSRLLVAGGTDGFIHGWKAEEGNPRLFDLRATQNQNMEFRVWEHEGPITCLALDLGKIYSGSWDMTVRVWDRAALKCLLVLVHNDWVWSVVPHDNTIGSTAGSGVYIWETNTGNQLAIINGAHVGNAYSLARSHTGKLFFTGGEDGSIHMFEMNKNSKCNTRKIATWMPHSGPVYSLAFEFPWLVSASSDGKISLIDIRELLKKKHSSENIEPPQRMLHGFGCNLFSVAVGSDRIVCGGEEGVVRIWNFSQALEIEKRARALRGIRLENRMRRRKLQLEMSGKGHQDEQCSVAAKKNQISKRRVSGKINA